MCCEDAIHIMKNRDMKWQWSCQVEYFVSTYRFVSIVFFIVVVGPDGYLWQEPGYVGQGCNLLFVFHAAKKREKTDKTKGRREIKKDKKIK